MVKKELFIQKATIKHNGIYDYEEVDYKTARIKVKIKCRDHGIFEQTPDNHLNKGNICPECAKIQRSLTRRMSLSEFVERSKIIHKNKYDYSKVEYKKWDVLITIKCPIHEDFQQTPNAHLSGKGCQKCGIQKMADTQRKTHEEFIKEVREIHGIKYDYSKVEYKDYHTPVIIGCSKHGNFEQTPSGHLSGKGCRKCGDEYRGFLCRKSTEQFIKESVEIHGDLYIYDKVNYQTQTDDVVIICKIHGEFSQMPSVHLRGNGCQKCGIIKNANSNRKTTEEFIHDAIEIHGNKYNYENVDYINSRENVIIVCSIHGEFLQDPVVHLRGSGCPDCASDNIGLSNLSTLEEFVEKAKGIHGLKYDYTKINYINSITKVIIVCPIHGDFLQTPGGHLSGGCKSCALIVIGDKRRKSKEQFIKEVREIHGDKYCVDKVDYFNSTTNIILTCNNPLHGDFKILPSNILRPDRGCPKCSGRFSNISKEWLNMIKVNHPNLRTYDSIDGEYRIPNTRYYADGYDEKTNTVFEFHGDYWHGNPEIFQSDQINLTTKCTFGDLYNKTLNKRKILEEIGYKYVEVWENDWKKLKKLVLKKQRFVKNKTI